MKTNKPSFLTVAMLLLIVGPVFAGNLFQGITPANVPLPGGEVHYQFDTNLTVAEQQVYLNGLREWELAANIHFVPHATETNWILFKYAPGTGIDTYDTSGQPWTVTISVLSRSQVCHEMGHVLGLAHENIRVDKTNYVSVLTNNISPASNIFWFTIDPTTVPYGPYDFESVMHLADNFSSVDPLHLYTQVANPPYQRFTPRMGNLALSAGDRATMAHLYGPPSVPLTNIVTTTADFGSGSLRAALYYGIDHPGSTIRFNIPTNDSGFSGGVYTISLTGYLPPLVTNGTIIDGSTQPGFAGKPLIVIDGSQIIPEAYDPGTVTGLLIYAANCQVKNLSFQNFNWNGLTLTLPDATNNTIAGCWCGLDRSGTNAAPNVYQGILIAGGASSNIIGGTTALTRNVLSGNAQYGIFITDANTTGNVVRGNYIGTDASGMTSVTNIAGGSIITGGSSGDVFASNLISGNFNFGLWIDSSNNIVQGNWMGLDATGTAALPNTFVGMYVIAGAKNNLILSNVLSGNYSEGIRLSDSGTTSNTIQGNLIGTDPSGTISIPNYFAGLTFFNGAAGNTATGRNILSGNGGYGVVLGDSGTVGNLVSGNYIGVAPDGITAVANGTGALISDGAQSNTLGLGNLIVGNYGVGVWLTDPDTAYNLIQGNTIRSNGGQGIYLTNSARNNVIGLNSVGAGSANTIANNGYEGIAVYGSGSIGNTIRGNSIYSNNYIGINLAGGTEDFYGITANDLGDGDSGPNDLQNYPVLTAVFVSGSNTVLTGTLNSAAVHSYVIDAYRNFAPDASGYGEGQFYCRSQSVVTSGSGDATFSFSVPGKFPGQYFSVTATDLAGGDTSEFTLSVLATNGPTPALFVGPFTLTATGFGANISVTNGQSYHIQSTTNLATAPVVWTNVTNFTATGTNFVLLDHSATNSSVRFYRVLSP